PAFHRAKVPSRRTATWFDFGSSHLTNRDRARPHPAGAQSRPARATALTPAPESIRRRGDRAPRWDAGSGAEFTICWTLDAARRIPTRRAGRLDQQTPRGASRSDAQHDPPGDRPRLPRLVSPLPRDPRTHVEDLAVRSQPGWRRHERGGRGGARAAARQTANVFGARFIAAPALAGPRPHITRLCDSSPGPDRPGAATRYLGQERSADLDVGRALARTAARGQTVAREIGQTLPGGVRAGQRCRHHGVVGVDRAPRHRRASAPPASNVSRRTRPRALRRAGWPAARCGHAGATAVPPRVRQPADRSR